MRDMLFCALTVFLIASPSFSQTAPTDSQTLQALLAEVRQLRHDLRTTNAMSQRAQIALYRLQRQDEAVTRATQHLIDIRARLANFPIDRVEVTRRMQELETRLRDAQSPEERNYLEQIERPGLRSRLATIAKSEQETQAQEADALQQVHDEQVKLDALNDTLDRLNNALDEMSRK